MASRISRAELLRRWGRWGLQWLAAGSLLGRLSRPGGVPAAQAASRDPMTLRIGYLPITDATPLLLAHALGLYEREGLKPSRPVLFRSWSQLVEAFLARQVDVVHVLMPVAIWMRFSQNVPVRVVAWNHTDGSALTVAPGVRSLEELAGRTVAVPFWYSIHNVVLQLLLRHAGLTPVLREAPSARDRTVRLTVMAPPDMPAALASGAIAGFIVAEPFNALAELNRVGEIFRFTGDVWLHHACCVVVMHEEDIQQRPQWAQAVVTALARAQRFARERREETARLLSREGEGYLPQPRAVVARALGFYDREFYRRTGAIRHGDWPSARIDFQPFPFPSYTELLVRLLKTTRVEGERDFLDSLDPSQAHRLLVDDRFARVALQAAGGPESFGLTPQLARVERLEV